MLISVPKEVPLQEEEKKSEKEVELTSIDD